MSYEFMENITDSVINNESGIKKLFDVMKEHLQNTEFNEQSGIEHELAEGVEFSDIIGSPEKDMENWEHQTEHNSCAIACQKYVAEQLTGIEFSEERMIEYAKEQNWYDSETGTSLEDVGNLLEDIGLDVERKFDGSLQEITQCLAGDGKVICAINSAVLKCPEFSDIPGYKADHAVEITGVGIAENGDLKVIMNDPDMENGYGLCYDADVFLKSWSSSGNYMVSVSAKEAL